jgi:hypothetical protein
VPLGHDACPNNARRRPSIFGPRRKRVSLDHTAHPVSKHHPDHGRKTTTKQKIADLKSCFVCHLKVATAACTHRQLRANTDARKRICAIWQHTDLENNGRVIRDGLKCPLANKWERRGRRSTLTMTLLHVVRVLWNQSRVTGNE